MLLSYIVFCYVRPEAWFFEPMAREVCLPSYNNTVTAPYAHETEVFVERLLIYCPEQHFKTAVSELRTIEADRKTALIGSSIGKTKSTGTRTTFLKLNRVVCDEVFPVACGGE